MATTHSPHDSRLRRRMRRRVDHELACRYHRQGDRQARDELVRRLMPLAREQALRYAYTNEPVEDLIQVANLGLIKAIDGFDPARGTRVASYAVPTIRGELRRYFRDKGWAVHVPRDLQERAIAVSRAADLLSARTGRSPTMREIAAELDMSVEDVIEGAEAARSYDTLSLQAPSPQEDGIGGTVTLADVLGSDDESFSLVATRELVAEAWRALSDREREVVRMRVESDLTQREIGERIGFSQMHVSRILRRALERLTPPLGLRR